MSEEETSIPKEEGDKLLAEKYMRELHSESLGFTWRHKLIFLYENGYITEEEQNQISRVYLDSKETSEKKFKKKIAEAAVTEEAVKCGECGEKINAGTYGIVFNSLAYDNIAIKGSIQGHAITTGCPENFTKEFDRYQEIKRVFPVDLHIISLLNIIGDVWVEQRRCYFKMEKLYPIEFNVEQIARLDEKILTISESNRDLIYYLTEIRNAPRLYMLVPGITDPKYYFNEGGHGVTNGWREVNEPMMQILFEILGINIMDYYSELVEILKATMNNGIYLIDVEFILCSTVEINDFGELIRKNKIVMIDFDKVRRETENNMSLGNITLNQEMFPLTIQHEFPEPMRHSQAKVAGFEGGKSRKTRRTRKNKKQKKLKKTKKNKKLKTKCQKTIK
uniref:Uncharacterized protein n=1 Tax=viral metagenome TaxID=1070528 RepID=A0A6C0I2E5_9ZZZZ